VLNFSISSVRIPDTVRTLSRVPSVFSSLSYCLISSAKGAKLLTLFASGATHTKYYALDAAPHRSKTSSLAGSELYACVTPGSSHPKSRPKSLFSHHNFQPAGKTLSTASSASPSGTSLSQLHPFLYTGNTSDSLRCFGQCVSTRLEPRFRQSYLLRTCDSRRLL